MQWLKPADDTDNTDCMTWCLHQLLALPTTIVQVVKKMTKALLLWVDLWFVCKLKVRWDIQYSLSGCATFLIMPRVLLSFYHPQKWYRADSNLGVKVLNVSSLPFAADLPVPLHKVLENVKTICIFWIFSQERSQFYFILFESARQ